MAKPPAERLYRLKEAFDKQNIVLNELKKSVGFDPGCPLSESIFEIQKVAAELTAEVIGVEYEALDWFIYEDEWGKNKRKAAMHDELPVVIDSIEAFLRFEIRE